MTSDKFSLLTKNSRIPIPIFKGELLFDILKVCNGLTSVRKGKVLLGNGPYKIK